MEIINLFLRLGSLHFFQDLSFTLKKGALNTLKGKNGSGKSTLFAALRGELSCQGILKIDDETLKFSDPKIPDKVVLISQQFDQMIADEFSFRDNLKFAQLSRCPFFHKGLSRALDIPPLIERFGIDQDQPARVLSGGQRQILAILMALQKKPLLLLLDEPTATLDPVNARMVFKFLTTLIEQRSLTAFVICHDHELINSFRTGYDYSIEVQEEGRRLLFEGDFYTMAPSTMR